MSDLPALPARLVFRRHTDDGLPARLVFGDSGEGGDNVTLHSSARLSGLRGFVRGRVGVRLGGGGRISGLRGYMSGRYDVNVERPLVGQTKQHVQAAAKAALQSSDRWQDSARAQVHVQQHQQQALRLSGLMTGRWQDSRPLTTAMAQRQQQALRLAAVKSEAFADAVQLVTSLASRTQAAARLAQLAEEAFEDAGQLRTVAGERIQQAERLRLLARHAGGSAVQLLLHHAERTQQATHPGLGVRPPVKPEGPKPCHPDLPALLCFELPATGTLPARLYFHCCGGQEPGGETIVVPVQKVYIVLNSIYMRRVRDNAVIPAYSFGMSLDVGSWTWSWQASLHSSALALIQPEDGQPVEVVVAINNVPYRLLIDGYSRERTFASTRINVSGRGRSAVLDSPFSPALNYSVDSEMTARQLAEQVLTINGVPNGWGIDWQLNDWLVPAGAWSMQGSYIQALTDIASSVGGYLQPHNTDTTLRILPRYPSAPWRWGVVTPDYSLPSHAVSVEGIEWLQNAEYNRIFVSGEGVGVLGQVTRMGTAGDLVAPMVTHPLITHADAARQRGITELGPSGRQQQIRLSLQVLPQTGVIKPGSFVRYVLPSGAHLGLVRSTSVDWQGDAKLRQSITLEVPEFA